MAVLVPDMESVAVGVVVVVVAESGGAEVAAKMRDVARDALMAVVSLDEEDEDEDT